MKIKDSKFYKPIRIMWANDDFKIELQDKHESLSSNQPYSNLLDDLLYKISLNRKGLVIQRDKLKHFERCTDFYSTDYSAKQNLLYEDEICYFHLELEVFILVDGNLSDDYEEEIFEEGLYQITSVFYDSKNPKAEENLKKTLHGIL